MTNRVRPGFGSNDPLLRAIAEHWDDIERRADPRQRQLFAGLVAGTAELDPDEARAALADELLDILPPDHPVSLILRSGTMYSPAPETPASVTIDVDRRSRRRHAADSQLVLAQDAEEDFEFGKDCFGLDQCQARLYTAIARHTVLVMAALAICAVT
ncbi:MAG: hypothetical protein ABSB76_39695, partial [Streptosporangiaceae bacterium]